MLLRVHTETVHHWWNGTWGRLNRRDVYVRTDGATFDVEVRLGGASGRRWRREFTTLPDAVDEAARHRAADQTWRDVTAAHRLHNPAGRLAGAGEAVRVGGAQVPHRGAGVDAEEVALVPHPGADWPRVVGALVDGVDLVVVSTAAAVPAGTASALMARARRTGAVLLPVQDWPGSHLRIEAVERRWYGLGQGRGRLRAGTRGHRVRARPCGAASAGHDNHAAHGAESA
jgi:hypothetical protein